ncbi:MAG: DUF1614 domain-containing protein [Candidatus Thermoplasmatota archaeon]|jgi:uncharacterized membrane protein|nr:DUF1614 domain-containing protein [Candidatus Thermoplasmatota archaeon]
MLAITLTELGLYILYVSIPILILYIAYLVTTKAFKDMGFSSIEATIIILVSFILGYGIIDEYIGFSFANIQLFTYNNWVVGINTGGAIIPILLSIYLVIKKKLPTKKLCLGIIVVAIVTFFVTYSDPSRGIVSHFPLWLVPAFLASILSVIMLWRNFRQAASLAYVSGTIGVLIGADLFHLLGLLKHPVQNNTPAVIGGANVFDMVFITGILAVIVDGLLMYKKKTREKKV